MVSSVASVDVKLSRSKLAALKRGAKRLGLTPAAYMKELIEDGLARERRIRETPLETLAAPWQEALKGMTDDELDAMVEEGRRSGTRSRRRR